MKAAGIPCPRPVLSPIILKRRSRLAEKMGYPVVMKIVSKDILHKSDVGGVALDLAEQERGDRSLRSHHS